MIDKLADLVCSPFPLITGVSREVWAEHCEDKEDEMNEEAAIFFLATNELRTRLPFKELPAKDDIIQNLVELRSDKAREVFDESSKKLGWREAEDEFEMWKTLKLK